MFARITVNAHAVVIGVGRYCFLLIAVCQFVAMLISLICPGSLIKHQCLSASFDGG